MARLATAKEFIARLKVRGRVADAVNRSMLKSINDIGHVTGIKTIAEFVVYDLLL